MSAGLGEGSDIGQPSNSEQYPEATGALHAKAKGEPGFRFYALYDKVYRADVLDYAHACCKANKGAAGVDGERFEDIEANGVDRWLGELAETLRKKTYQAGAPTDLHPEDRVALVDSH